MIKSRIIESDLKEIGEEIKDLYSKLSGKTILIAGGAGFLGRYLVSTLDYLNTNGFEAPCKIIIVDNFITGLSGWISENEHVKLVKADITQPLEIEEHIDYIINAASIASPVFYHKFRLETINAGFLGTRNLLELAREKKVERFLFISSSEIYGDPDPAHIPTAEGYLGNVSCVGPRACYDEPKRIGETLCVNYADVYDVQVRIARPFNIYGPGIRLDDGRVMPTFAVNSIHGNELPVHGDGSKTRTFCYITDATVGFFKILLSNGNKEVYNIGNDKPEISIKKLAELFLHLVKHDDSTVSLTEDLTDVYKFTNPQRRCPDLSKIKTVLDYNPKVSLKDGLDRFLKWVENELFHDERYTDALQCRVCNSEVLTEVVDLGTSPLANSLVSKEDHENKVAIDQFPLKWMMCDSCSFVQLSCTVNPDAMFRNYHYVSSTTETFRRHFKEAADHLYESLSMKRGDLVVDVGSNDGYMLKCFMDLGCRVQGIDPAQNIAELARNNGVDTIADYLNRNVVDDIVRVKGNAELVTANNVFAHTGLLFDFIQNVKQLLTKDGVFVAEVQYLLRTIEDLTFDNIYHEHVSYFTVSTLKRLFAENEMSVFHVEDVDTHGGSVRVYVQREGGKRKTDPSVEAHCRQEEELGLNDLNTYKEFAEKVYDVRRKVREFIEGSKKAGKAIVGYGAPAKATTLLNFCNINQDDIAFVVDDNKLKQGLIIPGTGIPIKSNQALQEIENFNVLILAWNFAAEIFKNNKHLVERDVRFFTSLPEPVMFN